MSYKKVILHFCKRITPGTYVCKMQYSHFIVEISFNVHIMWKSRYPNSTIKSFTGNERKILHCKNVYYSRRSATLNFRFGGVKSKFNSKYCILGFSYNVCYLRKLDKSLSNEFLNIF